MAFKGDDSTFSLAATVTLALAVAAMVFTKEPLQSSRPLGSGTGLHDTAGELKVRARLWEDPFEAVEKALEAQSQIAVQMVTDGKRVELVTATVGQQPQLGDGLNALHDKIKEVKIGRILALVVMTQGGSSVEVREERIRDRYAVGAALEVGCFVPDQGESLSYFMWDFTASVQVESIGASNRARSKSSSPKTGKIRLSQYTPYEWYSRSAISTCGESGRKPEDSIRHVLVLWVKAQEEEESILARINALISEFEKGTQPTFPLQVRLVGPRASSEFQSMLKEIEMHLSSEGAEHQNPKAKYSWQQKGKTLQIYSPWATAMPGLLSYGLKEVNGGACQSYAACETVFDRLLKAAGLDLSYRVTSDEVLFGSLMEELARWQVTVGQDRIVLIGEWDSLYARALPLTFTAAACQYVTTQRKDSRCNSIQEGIDQLLGPTLSPRALNIRQYSYLRGLDGEASEGQPKRSKSKKEDKERDKDKTEGKERFRDIDSYERPEGQAQLDYVRRLVARIKAECQDDMQAEDQPSGKEAGKVKAIGILGRDPYDALLILQAVREQFPNVLFFTTDLDARYFHEDEQKWTRNLIVASQFGVQLEPSLQQTIPPFRSSLQTSAFFAVLQAIERITPQPPESTIPPRLFEIGRHGAVDLSVDTSRNGDRNWDKSIHPTRVDVADDRKTLKLPPRIGLLWIIGLIVGFLTLWGYGRLWNWLTAWNEPDPTKHPLLWILRRAWVFIPAIVALWFWRQIVHFTYAEEEPFSWSDGVSIWPTEALRLVAISLCLFFLIKACADSVRNIDELTKSFFPDVSCRPQAGGWRNRLKGFWSDLDWMFHGSKQDHPGAASALWMRYCRAHRCFPRIGRVSMGLVIYFILIVPLCLFMNDGELRLFVPCRGTFSCSADRVFIVLSVLSFLVLNVAVLDAVILCTKWIQELPAATGFNEMRQIRLIVERTKIVNRRILYPFLALFLLIAARSHYFDNWDFPPVLILVLTVNSLVALASASLLYLAAIQAKRRILAPLQERLDRASSSADQPGSTDSDPSSNERFRRVISEIDAVQQGAFVPFYQQPVVQATLVAALAFLQYWYIGQ
jgi:hypothetical protein